MGGVRRIIRRNEPLSTIPTAELYKLIGELNGYQQGAGLLYNLMVGVGPGLAFAVDWDVDMDGMDWCAVEGLLAEYYSAVRLADANT